LILVACCAVITWSGLRIRDHLDGNDALRLIRLGTAPERQIAATHLRSETGDGEVQSAFSALMGALADDDPSVRAAAAESLAGLLHQWQARPAVTPAGTDAGRTRIGQAAGALVRLLSDRDSEVRAAAASALGSLAALSRGGSPSPEQQAALRDRSSAVRRQTARAIWGSPELPIPQELVAAIHDESAAVRTVVVRAIGRFGPVPDPVIAPLFAMAERDEPEVRRACFVTLDSAWPDPALVPALVESLKSSAPALRFRAAQLLGRIGPEAVVAVPDLVAITHEPVAQERTSQTKGFAWALDPACAAARSLGEIGRSREVVAALIEMLGPEFNDRFFAAVDGLADIGPLAVAAVPQLIRSYERVLASRDHVVGQMAIPGALGHIAPSTAMAPQAIATLIRALDMKNDWVRRGAIQALGPFGQAASAAIPKLWALQNDSEADVRNDVAATIAAIEGVSQPKAISSGTRKRGHGPASAAD
jgi:HEAT repeat protein